MYQSDSQQLKHGVYHYLYSDKANQLESKLITGDRCSQVFLLVSKYSFVYSSDTHGERVSHMS